ncbi:MAG: 50S ribosomal protein L2 [Candidatus Micrarchaeaceae archaeon]
MGKKLKQQRRGKGSNAYSKPPHAFDIDVRYSNKPFSEGEVTSLFNSTGRIAPIMEITYEDFKKGTLIAPEGIKIGDKIYYNKYSLGSVMELKNIQEGVPIYNLELKPGDGGKLVRSAGSTAFITMHNKDTCIVQLPSKATITLSNSCRAQLGVCAGGGFTSQPLVKAGKNYYIKHATNKMWPKNRGVKMNPVDHPFGGKQHHKGKSSMTSRNAPPGRKVGHIAARRVGRKKR